VKPGAYLLDDARGIEELVNYGRYDGRHRANDITARFLTHATAPFVPEHQLGA
jgi:hypothetical protein